MTDSRHQPPVDSSARLQALDPGRSFIVQAPAGSGKTELLIQRILALLATVERPEEILAITFTRKAAAEMQVRLLDALVQAAGRKPPEEAHALQTYELATAALARDRAQGWQLLESPNRLQLMTIDSFCAGLTRRMPWLSRFGAQPETVDDPRELYRLAAERTVGQVEQNGPASHAARRLLRHLDNRLATMRDMLVDMLARRDQWLRHLLGQGDDARQILEDGLGAYIERDLSAVFDALGPDLRSEIAELSAFAADNLDLDYDTAGFPEPSIACWSQWLVLRELLLTKQGSLRASVNKNQGFPPGKGEPEEMKSRMVTLLETLAEDELLCRALVRLQSLPLPSYRDHQWEILNALVELLPFAVVELQKVFRDRGHVDFVEVAGAARAALGRVDDPEDLLLQFDSRISHILVDEFQDTNFGQFVLLEQLTAGWTQDDGRTLFVVGDPMQSIYRFREAEVGLYLRVRRLGLNRIALEPLALQANFRSGPSVVDWVNQVFGELFPVEPDELRGAVPFAPAVAARLDLGDASVSVTGFVERQDRREAEQVLSLIRQAESDIPDGEIAVLVRSRAHLLEIVALLNEEGLDYQAREIDPLRDRPVIQDLCALTRAILHPADRVAWLSILRAPWCGLLLDELLETCADSPDEAIWELLCRPVAQVEMFGRMDDDGRARVDRFISVMTHVLTLKGRIPLRRLVEAAWLGLGGPACLQKNDLQDAEQFFAMLTECDLGGDLERLETIDEQVEKLFAAADATADSRLQLMTIHKAKGLEFDTVILPGLGRQVRGRERTLLRWQELADDNLLLAPIPALDGGEDPTYQAIGTLMREKDDHETLRLLYVATTRARRRLHLLGHVTVRSDGQCAPVRGSLLDAAWPAIQETVQANLVEDDPETENPEAVRRPIRSLPLDWSIPNLPEAIAFTDHRAQTASHTESALPLQGFRLNLGGEQGRVVGIVTHGWLEKIATESVDAWPTERLDEISCHIAVELGGLGIGEKLLTECTGKVLDCLRKTLSSERGRWLLADHTKSACELPLTGLIDGELVHAVIDRSFVDEQGTRWVVDYKTSTPKELSIEAFCSQEEKLYRNQVATYARLFKQLEPDRPVRAALYFPAVDVYHIIET